MYEQWDADEEPLPVDELPEWDPRRPQPVIDFSKMDQFKDTDDFMKYSKKGKTMMLSVIVRLELMQIIINYNTNENFNNLYIQKDSNFFNVIFLFDHEEIGSTSA